MLHGTKAHRMAQISEAKTHYGMYDVYLTTYDMLINEETFFTEAFLWRTVVIDEAHRLKSEMGALNKALARIDVPFRLLLTGTPLQNNLHELWSLLNFLLPKIFTTSEEFDSSFNVTGVQQVVDKAMLWKARGMLKPFLLRRVKSEVEKELLEKNQIKIYVPLSKLQIKWYKKLLTPDGLQGILSYSQLMNIMMQLRKLCNHPKNLLHSSKNYTSEETNQLFETADGEGLMSELLELQGDKLITSCGKLAFLDKLLQRLKNQGSRVLLFSQFTSTLDILEEYVNNRGWKYFRLDGTTPRVQREMDVADFNSDSQDCEPIFLYLISTKAGGQGINLSSANTVIHYDSNWNPQVDLQAEDRAHRIGQRQQVNVYRLVSENTVEEKILQRAQQKLFLDAMVIKKQSEELTGVESEKIPKLSMKELYSILKFGTDKIFKSTAMDVANITDADVEALIKASQKKTTGEVFDDSEADTEDSSATEDLEKSHNGESESDELSSSDLEKSSRNQSENEDLNTSDLKNDSGSECSSNNEDTKRRKGGSKNENAARKKRRLERKKQKSGLRTIFDNYGFDSDGEVIIKPDMDKSFDNYLQIRKKKILKYNPHKSKKKLLRKVSNEWMNMSRSEKKKYQIEEEEVIVETVLSAERASERKRRAGYFDMAPETPTTITAEKIVDGTIIEVRRCSRKRKIPKRYVPEEEQVLRKKRKIQHEDYCFCCDDGGELLECVACPKVYHLQCVQLDEIPKGTWRCPWHTCYNCGNTSSATGGILLRCTSCPLAYCYECFQKLPTKLKRIYPDDNYITKLVDGGFNAKKNSIFFLCVDCKENVAREKERKEKEKEYMLQRKLKKQEKKRRKKEQMALARKHAIEKWLESTASQSPRSATSIGGNYARALDFGENKTYVPYSPFYGNTEANSQQAIDGSKQVELSVTPSKPGRVSYLSFLPSTSSQMTYYQPSTTNNTYGTSSQQSSYSINNTGGTTTSTQSTYYQTTNPLSTNTGNLLYQNPSSLSTTAGSSGGLYPAIQPRPQVLYPYSLGLDYNYLPSAHYSSLSSNYNSYTSGFEDSNYSTDQIAAYSKLAPVTIAVTTGTTTVANSPPPPPLIPSYSTTLSSDPTYNPNSIYNIQSTSPTTTTTTSTIPTFGSIASPNTTFTSSSPSTTTSYTPSAAPSSLQGTQTTSSTVTNNLISLDNKPPPTTMANTAQSTTASMTQTTTAPTTQTTTAPTTQTPTTQTSTAPTIQTTTAPATQTITAPTTQTTTTQGTSPISTTETSTVPTQGGNSTTSTSTSTTISSSTTSPSTTTTSPSATPASTTTTSLSTTTSPSTTTTTTASTTTSQSTTTSPSTTTSLSTKTPTSYSYNNPNIPLSLYLPKYTDSAQSTSTFKINQQNYNNTTTPTQSTTTHTSTPRSSTTTTVYGSKKVQDLINQIVAQSKPATTAPANQNNKTTSNSNNSLQPTTINTSTAQSSQQTSSSQNNSTQTIPQSTQTGAVSSSQPTYTQSSLQTTTAGTGHQSNQQTTTGTGYTTGAGYTSSQPTTSAVYTTGANYSSSQPTTTTGYTTGANYSSTQPTTATGYTSNQQTMTTVPGYTSNQSTPYNIYTQSNQQTTTTGSIGTGYTSQPMPYNNYTLSSQQTTTGTRYTTGAGHTSYLQPSGTGYTSNLQTTTTGTGYTSNQPTTYNNYTQSSTQTTTGTGYTSSQQPTTNYTKSSQQSTTTGTDYTNNQQPTTTNNYTQSNQQSTTGTNYTSNQASTPTTGTGYTSNQQPTKTDNHTQSNQQPTTTTTGTGYTSNQQETPDNNAQSSQQPTNIIANRAAYQQGYRQPTSKKEPPSLIKFSIQKLGEFVLRNGVEFEQEIASQTSSWQKFPFLDPTHEWHSYYKAYMNRNIYPCCGK